SSDVCSSDLPLARVLDFQRRTVELVADEMRPIAEGWVARTPSLPAAWWLNNIWVGAPLSFEDLMSLCEQHRRGATFDHLHVDEAGGGQALEETFRAHRWAVE